MLSYTQEIKRLEECMKQKEFLDLLNEYAKEISDPKNLKEQEEYLRQIEREQRETGENPFSHQIIVPKPVSATIQTFNNLGILF